MRSVYRRRVVANGGCCCVVSNRGVVEKKHILPLKKAQGESNTVAIPSLLIYLRDNRKETLEIFIQRVNNSKVCEGLLLVAHAF